MSTVTWGKQSCKFSQFIPASTAFVGSQDTRPPPLLVQHTPIHTHTLSLSPSLMSTLLWEKAAGFYWQVALCW